MTPGSVGGGRNVNPSSADEVFAEHGFEFTGTVLPRRRRLSPPNYSIKGRFLTIASFPREEPGPPGSIQAWSGS
jgi:hypothetical protein